MFGIVINRPSFSLDKSSGKKCHLLAARELSIEWGFIPEYWRWISLPEESRFPEVAELNRVYWFDIRGKVSTSILSPKTRYAAYLVYKLRSGAHGFDGPPFKASVGTVGGEVYEQTVRLGLFVMEPNQQDQIIPSQQQHISRPKQREDGWLEIELGQFFNRGGEDDELQINLWRTRPVGDSTTSKSICVEAEEYLTQSNELYPDVSTWGTHNQIMASLNGRLDSRSARPPRIEERKTEREKRKRLN
uniref:Uncharacterized protein n=1 Tax=Quercus lobata TaxID=97700 RepID=A0A7N2LEU0_QUELO